MVEPTEWVEDDELWIESYATMFPAGSFEAARGEVDLILARTGVTEGAVLDLACGPGRHSVPFAQRGLAVTGVDRNAFLLSKARAYAAEEKATVEWVERDMREYVRPEAFELAVCLFTSFGLFEDDADNQRVLENVYRSLRPGAAFVLDVGGKEVLARIFEPTDSREVGDGRVFLQRREVADDFCRIDVEWTYMRGDDVSYTKRFRHWIYSARELREMLQRAGFAEVATYGDLAGAPYDRAAKRLVAVGRKRAR